MKGQILSQKDVKNYPPVMNEYDTLEAAVRGASLSRFGDGELRICLGKSAVSQLGTQEMAREMMAILQSKHTVSLPCIPNVMTDTPKWNKCWHRYAEQKWINLYRTRSYGSAFITRPDSAPWINIPDYWALLRSLWQDKDVCLVMGAAGGDTSLNPHMLRDAKSVRTIIGPRRDAWREVNVIEKAIGMHTGGPVILCLGATATVLAERVAKKGMQGLDLGHVGKMMPREFR